MAWVVTHGPETSFKTAGPAILPALPATVGQEAAPVNAGGATLPLRRQPDGMPSPAAAASIQFERTGTLPMHTPTSNIHFDGIPSPAAAASLDPNAVLPLKRSDSLSIAADTPGTVSDVSAMLVATMTLR